MLIPHKYLKDGLFYYLLKMVTKKNINQTKYKALSSEYREHLNNLRTSEDFA